MASVPGVWIHRLRVTEAAVLLLVAKSIQRLSADTRWERILGQKSPVPTGEYTDVIRPVGRDRKIYLSIRTAEDRLPVIVTCLDKAMVGRWMLKRRGGRPQVVIGIGRVNRTDTHAWVIGDTGAVVTGGDVARDFFPITVYR